MKETLGKILRIFTTVLMVLSICMMIFTVIWGVLIFVRFLGFSGTPEEVSRWVTGLDLPPLTILLAIYLLYFVLGTVLEGIGIRRITRNFAGARLAGAFAGLDREAIEMVHWLLARDGLFVGGSAALGCVGAVKLARQLGPGKTIVTILCDGAARYASRLFNPAWLADKQLTRLKIYRGAEHDNQAQKPEVWDR